MSVGIIIHIAVGSEKRTEFFTQDRLGIGSDETCDLQIHTKQIEFAGLWVELESTDGVFRITKFEPSLDLQVNDSPIRRFIAMNDGDTISIPSTDISFSFFAINSKPSLITTNRDQPLIAQFIEEAALESATSPKRDDAKAFLPRILARADPRDQLDKQAYCSCDNDRVLVGSSLSRLFG